MVQYFSFFIFFFIPFVAACATLVSVSFGTTHRQNVSDGRENTREQRDGWSRWEGFDMIRWYSVLTLLRGTHHAIVESWLAVRERVLESQIRKWDRENPLHPRQSAANSNKAPNAARKPGGDRNSTSIVVTSSGGAGSETWRAMRRRRAAQRPYNPTLRRCHL